MCENYKLPTSHSNTVPRIIIELLDDFIRRAVSSPGLCLRLVEFDHIKHIILAAQVYTSPFVNALWHDVEDALATCCGDSPSLGNVKDHRSQADNK